MTDSGRNWVSLAWCKPEVRGAAPVVAYRVDAWVKGEGARWNELGVSPINSFDAFNLKPETEYVFRVTPRNRYGWGESISSASIVVGKPIVLPEFVKILPGQQKVLKGTEVTLECQVLLFLSSTLSLNKIEIVFVDSRRSHSKYKMVSRRSRTCSWR